MIKLWGRLSSINVQKVVWALEELGLAYERVDAGGAFGLNDTPEYRRLNPNGLVPTIEHDGFVLWESNAIVRYLCEGFGSGRFWPADRQVRASADRWMEWHATALMPAMRNAFLHLVRLPPARCGAGRPLRRRDGAERRHPRCPSRAPCLCGGRGFHHGRHRGRRLRASLAEHAAAAGGAAASRPVLRGLDAETRRPRQPASSARLSGR